MLETRQAVILHHLNLAMHHSALTFRAYATQVRDTYNQRTPAAARGTRFHETRDPYADERANAQILKRILDDAQSIPIELEESLVLCLPSPYQGECCRELAARIGQLAATIPTTGHSAAVADGATLMRETGEALAELAECFAGEDVLPHKRALASRAIGSLTDIEACVATLKARLHDAIATKVSPLQKAG